MFTNRRWLVIPAEEAKNINFNEILESSLESLRYSIDGTKTFIKYDVIEYLEDEVITIHNYETMQEETKITPAGIYGRPSIYKPEYPEYNHADMLQLLSTEEWTKPFDNE